MRTGMSARDRVKRPGVRTSLPKYACKKRGNSYFESMIDVTATFAANQFHQLLEKAGRGETIRIWKHGRVSVRMVPDCDFMSGAEAARLFAGYKATDLDHDAAAAIKENIARLDA